MGSVSKRVTEFFIIFLTIVIMGALFWVMLTMCRPYGYGDLVFNSLKQYSSYFTGLGLAAGGMTVCLVVMDVTYWQGKWRNIARLLIAINVGLYYLTALAGTERFPSSPVAVFLTICPIILFIVQLTLLRTMDPVDFMLFTGITLLIVAVVSISLFLAYAFGYGNFWDDDLRLEYFIRLDCVPRDTLIDSTMFCPQLNMTSTVVRCVHKSAECDEGFLFYITPLIITLFSFAMGSAFILIAHTHKLYEKTGKKQMGLAVRAFGTFLLLGCLGLWCASGIGGADIGLSNVVFSFVFLFLVIGCFAVVFVEGVSNVKEGVASQPLVARVLGWGNSDWIRSLLLILFFPTLIVILPLSFLNQMGRRYVPMTKTLDSEERKLWLSLEISKRIDLMMRWNWTSVWTKAIWWGVIFFTLSVIGARFINVFFSWLQEQMTIYNIGIAPASAIFVAVGFVTFMLPPIPGVPVYIACSVIIVPVCMREGWDFWAAWIYCSGLALVMRLLAVAGEQVMIGQWFGSNSVAVRRTVGVNSVEMRAIKFILMKKGLTWAKVSCLVGGPDWPMCVTAGILRTSLIQNLIGSLPVFFVIVPVTLAGALILKRNEGGAWMSAGTMALAVTGLVQTIMLGAAAYHIENTVQMHREELMSWPDDEAVKKYDEISNVNARKRAHVSKWQRLPMVMKVIILSGVLCEVGSAYLFQLFGAQCFLNFDITDRIETTLNNNVLNVIKPLGWVGIGLFSYGCVVLIVLGRWITCKVKYSNLPDNVGQEDKQDEDINPEAEEAQELEKLQDSKALANVGAKSADDFARESGDYHTENPAFKGRKVEGV